MDILIPVYIDHQDRLRNLNIVLKYLKKLNYGKVFVKEFFTENKKVKIDNDKVVYISEKLETPYFNKMKCFNDLAKKSNSDIIALYDVDVLVSPSKLCEAMDLINCNKADVVYPYNGCFYNIPEYLVSALDQDLNTSISLNDCELFNKGSWGGISIFNKNVFFEGGGCNENFKNVGYDDDELHQRFEILGYRVKRTDGILLHMNHFRGDTSYNYSKYVQSNANEVVRITGMKRDQLEKEIKTWSWYGSV